MRENPDEIITYLEGQLKKEYERAEGWRAHSAKLLGNCELVRRHLCKITSLREVGAKPLDLEEAKKVVEEAQDMLVVACRG